MVFLRARPTREGVGCAERGLTCVDDRIRTRERLDVAIARRQRVVLCVSEGLA